MFNDFWDELAIVFENFLFPESIEEQKQEDILREEREANRDERKKIEFKAREGGRTGWV